MSSIDEYLWFSAFPIFLRQNFYAFPIKNKNVVFNLFRVRKWRVVDFGVDFGVDSSIRISDIINV